METAAEETETGYIPPQNLEAERAILGAIFLSPEEILTKVGNLTEEDFYHGHHRILFRRMLAAKEAGTPVDVLTMKGEPLAVSWLLELSDEAVTTANAEFHARQIKDAALKRALADLCREGLRQIVNGDSLEAVMQAVSGKLQDISLGSSHGKCVTYRQLLLNTSERVETRYRNQGVLGGVPSGFYDLDELTDGWQPADLIILGARPGMGKSAISQVFAENAGVPVGIIQLEMGEVQTGIRALAREAQVEMWRLRKGLITKQEFGPLTQAVGRLAKKNIYVDFTSRKLADIERSVLSMVHAYGVKLLVIDYLQMADSSDKKARSRAEEVAKTSLKLKQLAKQFNIPVIALAQLNRAVEQRADGKTKAPNLADLKESGQIEQDADMVIFLWSEKPGLANLTIAKGRNCGTGQVQLVWDKDRMTFRNCEKVGR